MSYRLLPERGRAFVGTVTAAGTCVIGYSVFGVWSDALGPSWLILALLTLLSGSATVKLPSVPATISISETFVFTSVLLYGPSAGATIVALDGLIISSWFARRRKELYRIAFNMAAPALSIWVSAQVYFLFPDIRPLISSRITIEQIIVPLLVFTFLHFVINSLLIAVAVSFETGRNIWDIWRRDFLWLSLNYFGGASVSALLVVYTRDVDPAYLSIIVPLLLILYFTFKIPMARVEDTNKHLKKVNSLYLSTIETLALAIDAKDQVTHGHIRRVQTFAVELAKAIGIDGHDQLKAIEASALLHDMGKLAVPEYILNKPGKLTGAEFEKMKLHASIGADILSSIEFPYPVVPIVRHHHENWDGSGYPDGLCGVDIPIGARILSVVDCYDALTSDRPYRPKLSNSEATRILTDRRLTMYDPLVVDTFIRLQPALSAELDADGPGQLETAASIPVNQVSADGRRASEARLFSLYRVLEGLSGGDSASIVEPMWDPAQAMVPFEEGLFYRYDPSSDDLVCISTSHFRLKALIGRRVALGHGLTGWVGAQRSCVVNSPGTLDALGDDSEWFCHLGSAVSIPVVWKGTLLGVVTMYAREPQRFSSTDAEVIGGMTRAMAPFLRRSGFSNVTGRDVVLAPVASHQSRVPTRTRDLDLTPIRRTG